MASELDLNKSEEIGDNIAEDEITALKKEDVEVLGEIEEIPEIHAVLLENAEINEVDDVKQEH
jgi:hypothetical protein